MSEPTNPPDALGYCGLIIPARTYWQGIFILPELAKTGAETLKAARALPGVSETVVAIGGLSLRDQSVLGTLCGALITAAIADAKYAVGTLSWAIRELTGKDYFTVEGKIEGDGIRTFFNALDVDSIDKARDAIEALPQVVLMKLQIIADRKSKEH